MNENDDTLPYSTGSSMMSLMDYISQYHHLFKDIRIKDFHQLQENLYLVVSPDLLTKYKEILEFKIRFYKVRESNGENFYEPLCFDPFFDKCKEQLEIIFTWFKKDKIFSQLLVEICQAEVQQDFLVKANILYRSKKSATRQIEQ